MGTGDVLGRYSRGIDGEKGQTGAETAVLVGLVAIGLIIAVFVLRGSLTDSLRGSGNQAGGTFEPPTAQCDASYTGACIPSAPPDLNCDDLEALGVTEVALAGKDDPHGFDADGDGIGCNEP
jgi:Flp pilus assembly pilin Flp